MGSRGREIDETTSRCDDTMPAELSDEVPVPNESGDYPDGEGGAGEGEEVEDLLMLDLTHEEIKAAFRLFDDSGEGFITVMRFRIILKEIDEEFTEDELDEIIAEIDTDKSDTIDFNEFVKIMT